jgi:hypothetical protein
MCKACARESKPRAAWPVRYTLFYTKQSMVIDHTLLFGCIAWWVQTHVLTTCYLLSRLDPSLSSSGDSPNNYTHYFHCPDQSAVVKSCGAPSELQQRDIYESITTDSSYRWTNCDESCPPNFIAMPRASTFIWREDVESNPLRGHGCTDFLAPVLSHRCV